VDRSGRAEQHIAPLSDLGIEQARLGPIAQYLALVEAWNERTNLTAARNAEERVRVLIADAWRAAPEVQAGSLIDVGSGNGTPGLVLALLRPDLEVTLLEPRAKRWAFLREAARALGRGDVRVERARCEDFRPPEPARTITMRAVGIPLATLSHLMTGDGQVLVFGGNPAVSDSFHLERTVDLGG
jgi:16S rRNA (guanine527-N7)-methyltransferase